jgi:glycosyltransferase involved in cell wall biosynthesis
MELVIALEHRFARTPDGAVWTPTALARASWDRYLGAFGTVHLLARVEDVPQRDPRWARVDGDGVDLLPVPYYVGPREYFLRRGRVRTAVRAALDRHRSAAVILRVAGTIASVAADALRETGSPFAVEVVGDPHDALAPGATSHPLRPFFRWWATRELRRICREASSALYVTTTTLQRRYPTRPGVHSFGVSDVETGRDAFVVEPRPPDAPAGPPFRIVHVGTLAALYKGPDLLIDAVGRAAAAGLDVELTIVGDGQLRPPLEERARRAGIGQRTRFVGHLASPAAVRAELDRAHVFVLPSRQEGMPRAVVEAMARALPCLCSAIGGIPELLPAEAIVDMEIGAFAARILDVARDASLRARMSRENLQRARAFRQEALQPIREAFYRDVIARAQRGARTPVAAG